MTTLPHMKNFKPKPCPWCGGTEITNQVDYPYRVVCANFKCGAIGPNHLFRLCTRDAWNERAYDNSLPPEDTTTEEKTT